MRNLWRRLARDSARLQRLQTGLIVLLVLWSLSSVSQLVWIPFRANPIDAAPALALAPAPVHYPALAPVYAPAPVYALALVHAPAPVYAPAPVT